MLEVIPDEWGVSELKLQSTVGCPPYADVAHLELANEHLIEPLREVPAGLHDHVESVDQPDLQLVNGSGHGCAPFSSQVGADTPDDLI